MQIWLDGLPYEIKAGVVRQPLIEWPDNIRLDGQQLRKDRRYLSTWSIDDVSNGLGKQVDNSGGKYLWDVENVDTRIPGQKILSPALVTCTIVPSANFRGFFEYLNEIYIAGGSLNPVPAYKFTAPQTFGSLLTIGSTNSISGDGLHGVHVMGRDIVLAARSGAGAANYLALAGTLGAVCTTLAAFTGDVIRDVKFADVGGTVHALSFDEALNLYRFYLIPRLLGSMGDILDIAAPVGTQVSPLVSDGVTCYAQLPNGAYDFDALPHQVVHADSIDINPNQVLFQNYLLFKNKYSTIKYDGTDVIPVGYDRLDGLPSDKMGEITAFAPSSQRVYAAVKGATYSHILTYDGQGWQYYTRWPTAGIWIKEMKLTNAPDGVDRLWCIPGNYTFPCYFLNPLVNPLQSGTYGYVPTGHYTPPIYNGGMADIPGGWLRANLSSDAVGSGYNDLAFHYGLDGASPTTVLGNAGTTHSAMVLGSPYGVEGYQIQPKVILSRIAAQTGTTPVVRECLVEFLKDPNKRYTYDFDIDINKTANMWQRGNEAVIGSLNYVTNKKVLTPFWYGQIPTTAIKVLDLPADEKTNQVTNDAYTADRNGFVRVRVAEIL